MHRYTHLAPTDSWDTRDNVVTLRAHPLERECVYIVSLVPDITHLDVEINYHTQDPVLSVTSLTDIS
jgi:hypothetical protein